MYLRDPGMVTAMDDDGRRRMIESLLAAAVIIAGLVALIYWMEWTG